MKTLTLALAICLLAAFAAFGQTAATPNPIQNCAPMAGYQVTCWPVVSYVPLGATTPGGTCGAAACMSSYFWPLIYLVGGLVALWLIFQGVKMFQKPLTNCNTATGALNVTVVPTSVQVGAVPYIVGGPVPQLPGVNIHGYNPYQAPPAPAPAPMPPPPAPATVPATPPVAGGKHCTNCGASATATAKFCGVCGQAIP